MDINVEKFQKDFGRFCASQDGCGSCSLNELINGCYHINHLMETYPIILEWTEEHPEKTYLMDFKEKFPNSRVDDIAKRFCLKNYYGENAGLHPRDCKNCEDCWNREMKE